MNDLVFIRCRYGIRRYANLGNTAWLDGLDGARDSGIFGCVVDTVRAGEGFLTVYRWKNQAWSELLSPQS